MKTPNDATDHTAGTNVYRSQLSFAGMLTILIAVFHQPLWKLLKLAGASDLYSHIPLIPAISLYLVWLKRDELRAGPASPKGAILFAVLGSAFLVALLGLPRLGINLVGEDYLFFSIVSFVHFLLAGLLVCFGAGVVRQVLFPVAFLYLLAPMPLLVSNALAVGLQQASGEASHMLIKLSGTPVYREGMVLHMPGLIIEIAKECSGIRSSFVLFITSLLTGYLFLQSMRMRVLLALLVVPIGILRNALRILTISWLTIHVDSSVIHGPLHHRGGPLFFGLSLGIFFIILLLLRRLEKPKHPPV